MASGRVWLFRGTPADHEKVRDRLLYDHEACVEPVQQDPLRYYDVERNRRFGGADTPDHDTGRSSADQGFLHDVQRNASPWRDHGRLDALPEQGYQQWHSDLLRLRWWRRRPDERDAWDLDPYGEGRKRDPQSPSGVRAHLFWRAERARRRKQAAAGVGGRALLRISQGDADFHGAEQALEPQVWAGFDGSGAAVRADSAGYGISAGSARCDVEGRAAEPVPRYSSGILYSRGVWGDEGGVWQTGRAALGDDCGAQKGGRGKRRGGHGVQHHRQGQGWYREPGWPGGQCADGCGRRGLSDPADKGWQYCVCTRPAVKGLQVICSQRCGVSSGESTVYTGGRAPAGDPVLYGQPRRAGNVHEYLWQGKWPRDRAAGTACKPSAHVRG